MRLDELANLMPQIERASDGAAAELLAWAQELRGRLGHAPLCVEVGTWCGWTAIALALGGGLVVCVDPFTGADDQTQARAAQLGGSTLDRFIANVFASGVVERVLTLVGCSPAVARLFPDCCLDLVFLDGNHGADAVRADVRAWSRALRVGGVLCGHDWGQPTVGLVVAEELHTLGWPCPEHAPDGLPDQLWRVMKP